MPQGRVYENNKYRYLSKPDFENCVNYFRPSYPYDKELLIPPHVAVIPNPNDKQKSAGKDLNNVFSSYSEQKPGKVPSEQNNLTFGIPYDSQVHTLYDADDTCVGEVREKVKYMFATDNGVFIKKTIENGIFSCFSSYVLKDDNVFGIRLDKNGIPQFWMRFDDDVLLTVNFLGEFDPFKDEYDN
jgi:hypothetical protein